MADRKTARKPKARNTAEAMTMILQGLKEMATTVDHAAAMIQPEWQVATDEMAENPHMELILYADVADIRIYAVRVTDEAMLTVPPHVPKVSWSIQLPDQPDASIGCAASDIEQAKHFATLAYQAAKGVVTGGSA
jgi:hypothetical protein